jgi:hypothetical protein
MGGARRTNPCPSSAMIAAPRQTNAIDVWGDGRFAPTCCIAHAAKPRSTLSIPNERPDTYSSNVAIPSSVTVLAATMDTPRHRAARRCASNAMPARTNPAALLGMMAGPPANRESAVL